MTKLPKRRKRKPRVFWQAINSSNLFEGRSFAHGELLQRMRNQVNSRLLLHRQALHVGLATATVGKQVSKRLANCRHCGHCIAQGSVRFSYSWNLKKFHSFLHTARTSAYIKQQRRSESIVQQALAFLQRVQQQEQLPPEVLAAIFEVERSLQ